MVTMLTHDLNFQQIFKESSLFPLEQLLIHHTPSQTIAVLIHKLEKYSPNYSSAACRDYFTSDADFKICMDRHPFTKLLYNMWEDSSYDYLYDKMEQLLTDLSLDFIKTSPPNVLEYELAIKFIFNFVTKTCNLYEDEHLVYEAIYNDCRDYDWEFSSKQEEYIINCSHILLQTKETLRLSALQSTQTSVLPTTTEPTQPSEKPAMTTLPSKLQTTAVVQVDMHKAAAVQAATLELGETVLKSVKELIRPTLPPIAAVFLDTPFAELVIASSAAIVITALEPDNAKAKVISTAMLTCAYGSLLGKLKIATTVSDIISKIPDTLIDRIKGQTAE